MATRPPLTRFYAHTRDGAPESEWEPLEKHLNAVAELAAHFASTFSSSDWGRLAGMWHDLGKYHPRFQERLRDRTVRQPHAGTGAALAAAADAAWGEHQFSPLAYAIAGHHAGLANGIVSGEGLPRPLRDRLADARQEETSGALPNVPEGIAARPLPSFPEWLTAPTTESASRKYRLEFWTRFLFSALVDADRLATEAFCDSEKAELRGHKYARLPELIPTLEAHLATLEGKITDEQRRRPINQARGRISAACARAASLEEGIFSLTVPTGGGKTLAAMRFALRHAAAHDLRRVIVVLPYTSIIEQNAGRYAEVFGPENVLEHHSNLDPEMSRATWGDEITTRHELAAENWDAPIIVTTTVQFFESLFTNRPSRARKLHNITRSVIILDEVQSLPPQFLLAILDGLKQLTAHYGCSIVLSTATPPALAKRGRLPWGLDGIREITEDSAGLAVTLRRVRYEWPNLDSEPVTWPGLAAELAGEHQVLVVVHRRADARELAQLLSVIVDPATVHHLSALMCPAHRTEKLNLIRAALNDGRPCRLVSTQLIEAGVDVDFPIVYRAMGGLDAIVQAAGRCNREGRLESGRVVVFKAPTRPPGVLGKGLDAAAVMLRANESLDADDPQTQEQYFRRLYGVSDLDAKNIQREREQWNFATVGRDFKLIEDGFTRSVVIPWKEGAERLERLRRALQFNDVVVRELFRALQPYTVSLYERTFYSAFNVGAIEEVAEGLYALNVSHLGHYSELYGLVIGDDITLADHSHTVI